MTLNNVRILIVFDNPEAAATLTAPLMTDLDADVTIVDTIEQAKVMTASGAFDAIIAAEALPDGRGLSLLEEAEADSDDPVPLLLVDEHLDTQRLLSALRAGAVDVFTPPIETDRLTTVVRRAVRVARERRRREARNRRLRDVSSRLTRDRRELRQRVDLICRDLVQAYQRLAQKVVTAERPDWVREPPPLDAYRPRT